MTTFQNELGHNNPVRPFTIEAPVIRGSTTISPNLHFSNSINASVYTPPDCRNYNGQIRFENIAMAKSTVSPKMPYVLGTMVCKLNCIDPSEYVEMTVRSVIKELVDKCAQAVKFSTSKISAHRYQRRSIRQKPACLICGASAEDANIFGCDQLHSDSSIQIYNCLFCGRVFPSDSAITEHMATNHRVLNSILAMNRKPFISAEVGPFTVSTDLNNPEHRSQLMDQARTFLLSSIRCPICKLCVNHPKSNFIAHMMRYHRCSQLMVFRASCDITSFLTISFERMFGHIYMANKANKKVTCLVERDTISVSDLIKFKRKMNTIVSSFDRILYRCLPCYGEFDAADEFLRHFYSSHLKSPWNDFNWIMLKESGLTSTTRVYSCPHCEFYDSSVIILNRHLQIDHVSKYQRDAEFHCQSCSQTLSFNDLEKHFGDSECLYDAKFCITAKLSRELIENANTDDIISVKLTPATVLPFKRSNRTSNQRRASTVMRSRASQYFKSQQQLSGDGTNRSSVNSDNMSENNVLPPLMLSDEHAEPWASKEELLGLLNNNKRQNRSLSIGNCSTTTTCSDQSRPIQNQPMAVFACSICRYKAYSRDLLKNHTIVHEEGYSTKTNGDFVCFRCPYKTDTIALLFEHEICHTSYCPYRCTGCRSMFFDRLTAVNHLLVCVGSAHGLPSSQEPSVRALWKKCKPFNINLELSCYDLRELNSVKIELDNFISSNDTSQYDHSMLMEKALSVIAGQCGGVALLPPSQEAEIICENQSNSDNLDNEVSYRRNHQPTRPFTANTFQRSRGIRKRRRGLRFSMISAARKRKLKNSMYLNDIEPDKSTMKRRRNYPNRYIEEQGDELSCDFKKGDMACETQSNEDDHDVTIKKPRRQCEICGFRYGQSIRLEHNHARQHKLDHISSKMLAQRRYKCNKCPYASENSVDLRKHEYRHLTQGPFYCRICREDFCNELDCTDHLSKYHNISSNHKIHVEFYVIPEERGHLTSFRIKTKKTKTLIEDLKASNSYRRRNLLNRSMLVDTGDKSKIKREKLFTPNQQRHSNLNDEDDTSISPFTWDPDMLSLQQNTCLLSKSSKQVDITHNRTVANADENSSEQALHPAFGHNIRDVSQRVALMQLSSELTGHSDALSNIFGKTKRAYIRRQPRTPTASNSFRPAALANQECDKSDVCVRCHLKNSSLSNEDSCDSSNNINVLLHAMHCHSRFRPYLCSKCKYRAISTEAIQLHCILKHGIENVFTKSIDDSQISSAKFVIKQRFLCSLPELRTIISRNSMSEEFGGLNMFMSECSPLSFKCHRCCICFQHADQLAEHLQLASHIIQCRLCEQQGRYFPAFIRHFQKYHLMECIDKDTIEFTGCSLLLFRCVICQMDLDDENSLIEHLLCVHHLTPDSSLLSNTVLLSQLIQALQSSTAISIYRDLSKVQLKAKIFKQAKTIASEYIHSQNQQMIDYIGSLLHTCPICLCPHNNSIHTCSCIEFNLKTENNRLTKYGKRALMFNMRSIVESQQSNTQITQSWASAITPLLQNISGILT